MRLWETLIHRICFFAVLLGVLSCIPETNACDLFEFSKLNDQFIFSQYEGAVLRITAGKHVGTGFLIDAQQGYVLTAAHVVEEGLDDPSLDIETTSPSNPTHEFKLILKKELYR